MHLPAVTSSPAPLASPYGGEPGVPVSVMLLGVRVTAYGIINIAEHQRRETAGMGAVINPALLDRLMDLPIGISVTDPVAWAEVADQPRGVIERHEDSAGITRRLESPLTITDVIVGAAAGKELRAVQDASLFAGFTRRWITATPSRIPDAAMLEAKLCHQVNTSWNQATSASPTSTSAPITAKTSSQVRTHDRNSPRIKGRHSHLLVEHR